MTTLNESTLQQQIPEATPVKDLPAVEPHWRASEDLSSNTQPDSDFTPIRATIAFSVQDAKKLQIDINTFSRVTPVPAIPVGDELELETREAVVLSPEDQDALKEELQKQKQLEEIQEFTEQTFDDDEEDEISLEQYLEQLPEDERIEATYFVMSQMAAELESLYLGETNYKEPEQPQQSIFEKLAGKKQAPVESSESRRARLLANPSLVSFNLDHWTVDTSEDPPQVNFNRTEMGKDEEGRISPEARLGQVFYKCLTGKEFDYQRSNFDDECFQTPPGVYYKGILDGMLYSSISGRAYEKDGTKHNSQIREQLGASFRAYQSEKTFLSSLQAKTSKKHHNFISNPIVLNELFLLSRYHNAQKIDDPAFAFYGSESISSSLDLRESLLNPFLEKLIASDKPTPDQLDAQLMECGEQGDFIKSYTEDNEELSEQEKVALKKLTLVSDFMSKHSLQISASIQTMNQSLQLSGQSVDEEEVTFEIMQEVLNALEKNELSLSEGEDSQLIDAFVRPIVERTIKDEHERLSGKNVMQHLADHIEAVKSKSLSEEERERLNSTLLKQLSHDKANGKYSVHCADNSAGKIASAYLNYLNSPHENEELYSKIINLTKTEYLLNHEPSLKEDLSKIGLDLKNPEFSQFLAKNRVTEMSFEELRSFSQDLREVLGEHQHYTQDLVNPNKHLVEQLQKAFINRASVKREGYTEESPSLPFNELYEKAISRTKPKEKVQRRRSVLETIGIASSSEEHTVDELREMVRYHELDTNKERSEKIHKYFSEKLKKKPNLSTEEFAQELTQILTNTTTPLTPEQAQTAANEFAKGSLEASYKNILSALSETPSRMSSSEALSELQSIAQHEKKKEEQADRLDELIENSSVYSDSQKVNHFDINLDEISKSICEEKGYNLSQGDFNQALSEQFKIQQIQKTKNYLETKGFKEEHFQTIERLDIDLDGLYKNICGTYKNPPEALVLAINDLHYWRLNFDAQEIDLSSDEFKSFFNKFNIDTPNSEFHKNREYLNDAIDFFGESQEQISELIKEKISIPLPDGEDSKLYEKMKKKMSGAVIFDLATRMQEGTFNAEESGDQIEHAIQEELTKYPLFNQLLKLNKQLESPIQSHDEDDDDEIEQTLPDDQIQQEARDVKAQLAIFIQTLERTNGSLSDEGFISNPSFESLLDYLETVDLLNESPFDTIGEELGDLAEDARRSVNEKKLAHLLDTNPYLEEDLAKLGLAGDDETLNNFLESIEVPDVSKLSYDELNALSNELRTVLGEHAIYDQSPSINSEQKEKLQEAFINRVREERSPQADPSTSCQFSDLYQHAIKRASGPSTPTIDDMVKYHELDSPPERAAKIKDYFSQKVASDKKFTPQEFAKDLHQILTNCDTPSSLSDLRNLNHAVFEDGELGEPYREIIESLSSTPPTLTTTDALIKIENIATLEDLLQNSSLYTDYQEQNNFSFDFKAKAKEICESVNYSIKRGDFYDLLAEEFRVHQNTHLKLHLMPKDLVDEGLDNDIVPALETMGIDLADIYKNTIKATPNDKEAALTAFESTSHSLASAQKHLSQSGIDCNSDEFQLFIKSLNLDSSNEDYLEQLENLRMACSTYAGLSESVDDTIQQRLTILDSESPKEDGPANVMSNNLRIAALSHIARSINDGSFNANNLEDHHKLETQIESALEQELEKTPIFQQLSSLHQQLTSQIEQTDNPQEKLELQMAQKIFQEHVQKLECSDKLLSDEAIGRDPNCDELIGLIETQTHFKEEPFKSSCEQLSESLRTAQEMYAEKAVEEEPDTPEEPEKNTKTTEEQSSSWFQSFRSFGAQISRAWQSTPISQLLNKNALDWKVNSNKEIKEFRQKRINSAKKANYGEGDTLAEATAKKVRNLVTPDEAPGGDDMLSKMFDAVFPREKVSLKEEIKEKKKDHPDILIEKVDGFIRNANPQDKREMLKLSDDQLAKLYKDIYHKCKDQPNIKDIDLSGLMQNAKRLYPNQPSQTTSTGFFSRFRGSSPRLSTRFQNSPIGRFFNDVGKRITKSKQISQLKNKISENEKIQEYLTRRNNTAKNSGGSTNAKHHPKQITKKINKQLSALSDKERESLLTLTDPQLNDFYQKLYNFYFKHSSETAELHIPIEQMISNAKNEHPDIPTHTDTIPPKNPTEEVLQQLSSENSFDNDEEDDDEALDERASMSSQDSLEAPPDTDTHTDTASDDTTRATLSDVDLDAVKNPEAPTPQQVKQGQLIAYIKGHQAEFNFDNETNSPLSSPLHPENIVSAAVKQLSEGEPLTEANLPGLKDKIQHAYDEIKNERVAKREEFRQELEGLQDYLPLEGEAQEQVKEFIIEHCPSFCDKFSPDPRSYGDQIAQVANTIYQLQQSGMRSANIKEIANAAIETAQPTVLQQPVVQQPASNKPQRLQAVESHINKNLSIKYFKFNNQNLIFSDSTHKDIDRKIKDVLADDESTFMARPGNEPKLDSASTSKLYQHLYKALKENPEMPKDDLLALSEQKIAVLAPATPTKEQDQDEGDQASLRNR